MTMKSWATSSASDLSPSWPNTTEYDQDYFNGSDPGNLVSKTVSLTSSQTKSMGHIVEVGAPNNDDWGSSIVCDIRIFVTANEKAIRGRASGNRLSSTGTILETTTYTSWQTLDTDKVYSFATGFETFTAGNCGDRFAIELQLENTNTMQTKEITYDLARATGSTLYIDAFGLSLDSGSCTGGSTFTPKCVMF